MPSPACKLRILLLSQEYPPDTGWGGIGVYSQLLAIQLTQNGHHVEVIARNGKARTKKSTTIDGITVHRIGATIARRKLIGRTLDKMWFSIEVAKTVRHLNMKSPFDVIETTEAGYEGWWLARSPKWAKSIVVQCHGSNSRGELPLGLLKVFHKVDWFLSYRVELSLLKQANIITVPSIAVRAQLLEEGIANSKIYLVPHGVDIEKFTPKTNYEQGAEEQLLRVGFVGRLEVRKGIGFFLAVAELLLDTPQVEFHLAGAIHPSMKQRLKKYSPDVLNRLIFHGNVPFDDMPSFYRSLDVLLIPSKFEAFGYTTVEGMSTGLIVIAGEEGAGSELIDDGVDGYHVKPDSSPLVIADLLNCILHSKNRWDAMRMSAREKTVGSYSINAWSRKKLEVYYKLLRQGSIV